jgi:hypothetical protein
MSTTEPNVEQRPTAEPAPPEATVRALVVGCGIGIVLAAGNVYTALKAGFIDGGNITAALLGFVIFSSVKNLARRRYGPLENNITQTTAASAAIMSFVVGLPGPVAALDMMGMVPPGWAMAVWGAAAGLLGIAAAIVLRRKLIVDDALPFPTGPRHRRTHRNHPHRARGRDAAGLVAGRNRGGGDGHHLVPPRDPPDSFPRRPPSAAPSPASRSPA